MRSLTCLVAASLAGAARATLQVVPGATWTGTNTGAHMQAHGGGIIEVDSTYYLIGEDHTNGSAFQNVNCYSSTDLVEWTYVGALLSESADATSVDLGPDRVVERPKVLYNADTQKYVLWMHIDDSSYGSAKVGVATGDDVCGSYDYLGSWQPLGFQSRDINVFQDDDGSAYLLTEDRVNGLRIDAMTSDYLNVTNATYLWADPGAIEAPAMWKNDGYYFMFGSSLSGWDPNDNMYSYATSLSGPWSDWTTFADVGSNTYDSQTNYILPFGDSAMYLGDRWVSSNLMASTYVWLPLTVSSDNSTDITMADYVNWVPDASAGTWAAGPSENDPEAENATLAGSAAVVSCSGCSGGSAVGDIGGPSNGSVTFSGVSSTTATDTTIRVQYENGDSTQRFAKVTVNGVSQTLAFLPTADGETPGDSVLNCALKAGAVNTVVIEGLGDGTYGPDVDRIMVPVS